MRTCEQIYHRYQELSENGIILAMTRANKSLRKTMQLTGHEGLIGEKNFYPSVRTGVEDFRERYVAGSKPEL